VAFYPVSLDVRGQKCLVIGGGEVAYRKVQTLLEYRALARVVAPELIKPLQLLVGGGLVEHVKGEYHPSQLEEAFLVFGATDSKRVNVKVARDARKRNLPVNLVDSPGQGTFRVPAVLRQGHFTISISTGGTSPALARHIKEKLKNEYGPEMEQLTEFLGEVRKYVIARFTHKPFRKRLLTCLGDSRAAEFYRRGEGELWEKAVWAYIKNLEG